ncbi:uncharacterized protein HD556DRAFT_1224218, partial [Suillus plorans]
LRIRWTPGHVDIEGNELADVEAKKAAGGHSSAPPVLPNCLRKHRHDGPNTIATLPCSKSALKQQYYNQLKKEGQTIMHESPRYPLPKKIDDGVPSNQFQKLVAGLPQRQASLLMQLRMGHAPLNKHLHRIKRAETPLCPAGETCEESVHYFLMSCTTYRTQRDALRRSIPNRAYHICSLLNNNKHISNLFKYIAATKRLE